MRATPVVGAPVPGAPVIGGPPGRRPRSGRSPRSGRWRSPRGRAPSGTGRRRLRALASPLGPALPLRAPRAGRSPLGALRPSRSAPNRSGRPRPANCVVTVATAGRSNNLIWFGSSLSGGRGGSTEVTAIPSMPNSASARTTSPAFAPPYSSDPSSVPRGLSAPAARHVQVPSGRALVSSISMRRATAPKYNFARHPQITGLRELFWSQ